jgi:Protein of unknown function (DUF1638)
MYSSMADTVAHNTESRRFKLISCEVFTREMSAVLAQSPHQIDAEFLPKGLHDIGCVGMRERLQAVIDRVDESRYDAVILGYGLCNYGVTGLRARTKPLVVTRGHDCMTLFFGSQRRYLDYFNDHAGTYFLTSGWIERGEDTSELRQVSIQSSTGMNTSFEDLVKKYGEDNARYIYDQLHNEEKLYRRMTFIAMGVEPDGRFADEAKARATKRGWDFDAVRGDMTLIERLLGGNWSDDEFLVVPPGWQIVSRFDEGLIAAERCDS